MPGNRFAKRKDLTQNEIDNAGREAGWMVTDISWAGRGLPDSIWASAINNATILILVEAKTGKARLSDSEEKFHATFQHFPGAIMIVNSGACAVTRANEIRAQHLSGRSI